MPEKVSSYRVFLGMAEIAGYYRQLEQGLQALGAQVTRVGYNPFQYGDSSNAGWMSKWAHWVQQHQYLATNSYQKKIWSIIWRLLRMVMFPWALVRHDVFVFGFGTSFLGLRELPLLRALGKTIVFVFHGSDSRPVYIDPASLQIFVTPAKQEQHTKKVKRMLNIIERYANYVIALPASAHLHSKPLVNWLQIGAPYSQPAQVLSPSAQRSSNKVRILHSPSNPQAKGTPLLRAAIGRLQAKGLPIEWVEITKQPNHVVLQELQRCDFVVDQLYSDTPMAGFACEAAFFGKPAVVGTYATLADWDMPAAQLPPTAYCHPDQIESTIERLVLDAHYRQHLGQQAQDFVRQQWNAVEVAQRFMRLIKNEVPPEWIFDPRRIRYLEGAGVSKATAQQVVQRLVQYAGTQALELDDKPELLQSYLRWAGLSHDSQTPT